MKTQVQNDKDLDRLAAELLRASLIRADELDSIANAGGLFASVRSRVIADSVSRKQPRGEFTFFQRTAIITAAAAVIVVAVFGAMMFAKRPTSKTTVRLSIPPQQAGPEQKPFVLGSKDQPQPELEDVDIAPVQNRIPHVERAMDYRPIEPEPRTPARAAPQSREPAPEFYALAGLRSSEETINGGRIIRVELPRASLVALGVNVPLDSDKQLIKTDLLVGPDGVPRAIRLVE